MDILKKKLIMKPQIRRRESTKEREDKMEKTMVAVLERDGEVNGRQEDMLHNPRKRTDLSTSLCKGGFFFFPLIHSQGQLQAEFCNFVFCYILLKQIILKSSFW